jgi:hypothetical protein
MCVRAGITGKTFLWGELDSLNSIQTPTSPEMLEPFWERLELERLLQEIGGEESVTALLLLGLPVSESLRALLAKCRPQF